MDDARKVFEALLLSKGRDLPSWNGKKYSNINIQTYWRWFFIGWQMRGLDK